MKLPAMKYADNIKKIEQTSFAGYNHTLAAGDGEIYDMENLTSQYYPLLSPRPRRWMYTRLDKPNGIYCRDALLWVDGTRVFYDGEAVGVVEDSEKTFGSLGAYIVILPDKAYYNTVTHEFGSMESSFTSAEGATLFDNGTLYEEEAECNTITVQGVNWNEYFKVGDAITVSGCTVHEENNKTPIIREISEDGESLRFYEYIFKLDGDEGNAPYTEPGEITFARTVPDLDFICSNENRLWGCKGDTIMCCKLGDVFNWNVYDGLATDAYAVDVGSAGDFTGCISFLGYPVFFKEKAIYKVYGSIPSNFSVMGSATMGVAEGSGKSLAIAGEILFYLSRSGVTAYSGGIPSPISAPFGTDSYANAVAGSDGLKYYISMQDEAGEYQLFVYDTQRGMWHREDGACAVGFAYTDKLFMLEDSGYLLINGEIREPEGARSSEAFVSWFAEFGDFTEDEANKKGVGKLQIRLELDEDASFEIHIRYDSVGEWESVASLEPDVKRSYYLPVIPRRADHYRLRLSGTGGCRVFSIVRELYVGSALRSRSGRN